MASEDVNTAECGETDAAYQHCGRIRWQDRGPPAVCVTRRDSRCNTMLTNETSISPVGHAGVVRYRVLFAHSEHFQVPAGLDFSDQRRLVPVRRPRPPGRRAALGLLAAVGLRPAERGHRVFAVKVVRRVPAADAPSAAAGG